MSIHTIDFCKMELLDARRIISLHVFMDVFVLNPVLAVLEVVLERQLLLSYPTQSMSQEGLLLLNPLILWPCYHLLFSKLTLYYWKIAVGVVANAVVLYMFVSTCAFLLGFAERPIFFDLLSFLSCQILHWCP